MRVGILGGTFDPPHVGHLIAAADTIDALGLDRVVLVPASTQPLKRHGTGASPAQRLAMVRLAAADDSRLAVDSIEIDRAGLSFTVDTLTEWARRAPGDERFLLMGADVVRSFARWRDPLTIMRLAELVIWRRGDIGASQIAGWLPGGAGTSRPGYRVLDTRRVDVSSTEVRARVRAGRSIHGFVPDAVRAYIAEATLYRAPDDRGEGNDQRADQ